MYDHIASFLIRRRGPVLAVVILATIGSLVLVPRLRFDFTPQAVFEGNDDLVDYCEAFRRTFGYDDAVVMVVLEAVDTGDVLTRPALAWQAEAASALRREPGVIAVESIATMNVVQSMEAPPLIRAMLAAAWRSGTLPEGLLTQWMRPVPLVGDTSVDTADEARARRALDQLELVKGMLISDDLRLAAIAVALSPDARKVDDTREAVRRIRAVLDAHPAPAGYRLRMTGLPVLRTDIVLNLRTDLLRLLPAAAGFFLVVLVLLFRRPSGTLVPLLAVGTGLAWTVGVLILAHQSLNIVSNVLPIMLFVIGMANCVHLVSRYAEEMEHHPIDRPTAVAHTISHMARACLLTSLTTAVGFASLLAARSAVLNALGWHAILGIGLLYVTTIVVPAALLPSMRAPRHCRPEATVHPIGRVVGISGHAVARHPWFSMICSMALLAAAAWIGSHVVVNSYVIETYSEGHPTIRTMRLVEDKLSGILPMEISLHADRPGRFLEPRVYRAVAEAQRFARKQEPVLLAKSYLDVHQEVHANLSGDPAFRDELPTDDAAGAERIRRTEAILAHLDAVVPYHVFVTPDGMQARIMLRLKDVGARRDLELIKALEAELATLFPADMGVTYRLTGDAHLYAVCMNRFVHDLFYSLVGASVIIFAVIALLFWSFRFGLVSIPPNLTPLVVTLGYMGLRGYEMNASNVIVFAISLGIAVDNTIHFLARFREERVEHHTDVPEAIRRAYHGTGRAIVLTGVLIVAGLSVLHFSDFVPSRRFAELTSVTIIAALIGNLLLLPACLMLLWRYRRDLQ